MPPFRSSLASFHVPRVAGLVLSLAAAGAPLAAQNSVGRATQLPATTPAHQAGGRAATPAQPAAGRDTAGRLPNGKRRPAGWPVKAPPLLPGSILPGKRIIAYYGNPLSKRMGVLGEYPVDQMLAKFERELANWRKADPATPVQPALHLIAVVAQGDPGTSGKYRMRMRDTLVEQVYAWAKRKNALLFLDIQVGTGNLREELPRLEPFLSRPDVHLGIDPEFSMKGGHKPGTRIGTMSADDVNYASEFLQGLVTKYRIPPKVLVVHRFTRPMLTRYRDIRLDPRVQVVVNMDGWGAKAHKEYTYYSYVAEEPVQYTGFKLFYHNDQKKAGSRMMTPEEVLRLYPKPVYIQYQ